MTSFSSLIGAVKSFCVGGFHYVENKLEDLAHQLGVFIQSEEEPLCHAIANALINVAKPYLKNMIDGAINRTGAQMKPEIHEEIQTVLQALGLPQDEIDEFQALVDAELDEGSDKLEQKVDAFLDSKTQEVSDRLLKGTHQFLDAISDWLKSL